MPVALVEAEMGMGGRRDTSVNTASIVTSSEGESDRGV